MTRRAAASIRSRCSRSSTMASTVSASRRPTGSHSSQRRAVRRSTCLQPSRSLHRREQTLFGLQRYVGVATETRPQFSSSQGLASRGLLCRGGSSPLVRTGPLVQTVGRARDGSVVPTGHSRRRSSARLTLTLTVEAEQDQSVEAAPDALRRDDRVAADDAQSVLEVDGWQAPVGDDDAGGRPLRVEGLRTRPTSAARESLAMMVSCGCRLPGALRPPCSCRRGGGPGCSGGRRRGPRRRGARRGGRVGRGAG